MYNNLKISEYENLFDKHYSSLSKKGHKQLVSALKNPKDQLWNEFIEPSLIRGVNGKELVCVDLSKLKGSKLADVVSDRYSYMCLSSTSKVAGRSQKSTLQALGHYDFETCKQIDPRTLTSLFTNTMWFGDPAKTTEFQQCSGRTCFGPFTYITLEIDPPSDWSDDKKIDLLDKQLALFRRSGNSTKSAPIYKMIDWLGDYADFRGVAACYSGNKSIHIHLVFDTHQFLDDHVQLRGHLRPVFMSNYELISKKFVELFDLGVEPDDSQRFPEQFRKIPNGVHVVPRDKSHLFDVPSGTDIPQVLLFEHLIHQAPKGATRFMFDPSVVKQLEASQSKPTASLKRTRNETLSDKWTSNSEREYCEEELFKLIEKSVGKDKYPQLASLDYESQLIARLYVDATDKNPNLVILENGNVSVCQGGKKPKTHIRLPMPLWYHVSKWQKNWRRNNQVHRPKSGDDSSEPVIVEASTDNNQGDLKTARATFSDRVTNLSIEHPVLLVHTPEGFGKTTIIGRNIKSIADQVLAANSSLVAGASEAKKSLNQCMMAFSSYEIASEKCAAFNIDSDVINCRGVELSSFSKVYSDARNQCQSQSNITSEAINASFAGAHGYSSVMAAIRDDDPEIWETMKAIHTKMFAPVINCPKDKQIVYFTVHDVLHQWGEDGLSPLFCHPDFFDVQADQYNDLIKQNKLLVAVHDELTYEHFVHMEEEKVIKWCHDLFEAYPDEWGGKNRINASDAYSSWESYNQSKVDCIKFGQVLDIYRRGYDLSSSVGVGRMEPYGVDYQGNSWMQYACEHHKRYVVKKRQWWKTCAQHTVLLTTEILPKAIFSSESAECGIGHIYSVTLPTTMSGVVDLHVFGSLKAGENSSTVASMRDYFDQSDLAVICDGVDAMANITTYKSAKGSNNFIGKDVMQIMNFLPAELYGQLQVINSVYDLDAALHYYHIDLFNQAVGRNLGCRAQQQPNKHHLVISSTLWNTISDRLLDHSRYVIREIANANQRRDRQSRGSSNDDDNWNDDIIINRTSTFELDAQLDALVDQQIQYTNSDAYDRSMCN